MVKAGTFYPFLWWFPVFFDFGLSMPSLLCHYDVFYHSHLFFYAINNFMIFLRLACRRWTVTCLVDLDFPSLVRARLVRFPDFRHIIIPRGSLPTCIFFFMFFSKF